MGVRRINVAWLDKPLMCGRALQQVMGNRGVTELRQICALVDSARSTARVCSARRLAD